MPSDELVLTDNHLLIVSPTESTPFFVGPRGPEGTERIETPTPPPRENTPGPSV